MIPRNLPATLAIICACVMVYLLSRTGLRNTLLGGLMISQYVRPVLPEISAGEVWRLFTPILLHFSLFHVVFNMLWTWEFGRIIEFRYGAISLLGVTLLTGAVANLAQYLVSGPGFGGMSGVIYGYLGFVWVQSRINPRFGIVINRQIVNLLLIWFAICWSGILKVIGLHIANTAHTAGLLSGMLLALIWALIARIQNSR